MFAGGTGWGTAQNLLIKSIQRGLITIAAAATSGSAAISAVDPNNSITIYQGVRTGNAGAFSMDQGLPRIDLTSGTLVTAQTNTADATNTRLVRFTVIEFYPWAVKSVQRGTLTIAANSAAGNVTVSSVNTANALLLHLGQTTTKTGLNVASAFASINLFSATQINGARTSDAAATTTVSYELIEFNPGVVNRIQQAAPIIGNGVTTGTATITSVNTANSMIFYNGGFSGTAGDSDQQRRGYVELTNGTTVTATRSSNPGVQWLSACTVVEFLPKWIKSLQRGVAVIAISTTTKDTTISSVSTTKAVENWLGMTSNLFASNWNSSLATAELQAATNFRAERVGSSASTTNSVSYEIVEFMP